MGTVWLLFIKPLFYIALQAFLSTFVLYKEYADKRSNAKADNAEKD